MNEVRKIFNRRSLGSGDAPNKDGSKDSSSRFRRRSKSRGGAQVAHPQDDPMTSAYSHESLPYRTAVPYDSPTAKSTSSPRISGPTTVRQVQAGHSGARDQALPGQTLTADGIDGPLEYEQNGSRQVSGNSSSSRFGEGVSSTNKSPNQGLPPVPPIPHSAMSASSTGSDARAQYTRATERTPKPTPIADQFSSASYYARQNSPPPAFFNGASTSSNSHGNPPQYDPYTTPNSTPALDKSATNTFPSSTSQSYSQQRTDSLQEDPILVGDTAAAGTRHAPNYADRSPAPSAYSSGSIHNRQSMSSPQRKALPIGQSLSSESDRSSTPIMPGRYQHGSSTGNNNMVAAPAGHDSGVEIPSQNHDGTHDFARPATTETDESDPGMQRGPMGHAGKQMLISGATEAPSLEGIVNLQNTSETIFHTREEPAVIHEHVKPEVQHLRHEMAQHDVHTHEVHHRVLPVKDVQTLPAKHFAPLGPNGELVEIDESQIPGTTGQNEKWLVDNQGRVAIGEGRHHTLDPRNLRDGEGDEKHYLNQQGVPTKETTWIHQPTFDTSHAPSQSPRAAASNTRSPDLTRDKSGSTLSSGINGSQRDYEQRGEYAVEAGRARGATAPSHEVTKESLSNAKFAAKPKTQQEREAEGAVLAARRAASHVPGSFV